MHIHIVHNIHAAWCCMSGNQQLDIIIIMINMDGGYYMLYFRGVGHLTRVNDRFDNVNDVITK